MVAAMKYGLLIYFIFLLVVQMNVGVADNGDFSDYMTWFVSKPAGFEVNAPPPHTPAWVRRFFWYYLPYWEASPPRSPTFFSSAPLFWLPGVILNRVFYSDSIIYLPIVTFPFRLALVGLLWCLLNGVEKALGTGWKGLLGMATLGLPTVLMLSDSHFIGYMNSFYREYPAFLALLGVLGAVQMVRARPTPLRLLGLTLAVALLASARFSYVLWAFLVVPWVYPVWRRSRHRGWVALLYAACISIAAWATWASYPRELKGLYRYSSLLDGALVFSRRPDVHLRRLGMESAVVCVGHVFPPFPDYARCWPVLWPRLKFASTLGVYLREPQAFLRAWRYAADRLRRWHIAYGIHSPDDPTVGRRRAILCLWSGLTRRLYPPGLGLLGLLGLYGWLFFIHRRSSDPWVASLSSLGLLVVTGAVTDVTVTLLGNGRTELSRTLFLARVLLDTATILALHVATTGGRLQDLLARLRPR
ncbi:hypothetical protein HRbin11_02332 [bacterium HR11]|nr:hypothetical protein HRbin11_02332 [bacterium HR11]